MRLIEQPADFRASNETFIFGAGEGGLIVYKALSRVSNVKVVGFIDNNKRGELRGLPIVGLDDVLKRGANARIVIASTYAFEIAAQLQQSGITDFDNALPLINAKNGHKTEQKRRLKALMTIILFFGFLFWLLV
ncbi:nucleoside-diphosphate sugar epimerase/dehydratase [Azospirillum sp. CT11-132]|uniref:nucleoside-diphosphate sugar epimerase/dehydratase n=1 Tax=Azospirillum sp. CT11-132 TaxID=3396317 RepID=UPI0039A6D3D6